VKGWIQTGEFTSLGSAAYGNTILMGFGLPDDGLHSPNEKYNIRNYYDGIRTLGHFFEEYGHAS
jgi:acetylornithine deacetylase/succinyl-diaminopimelate desuccinylase-like protein